MIIIKWLLVHLCIKLKSNDILKKVIFYEIKKKENAEKNLVVNKK